MKRISNRPAIRALLLALLVYIAIIGSMYALSIFNGHKLTQQRTRRLMSSIAWNVETMLYTMSNNATSFLSSYGTIDMNDTDNSRLRLNQEELATLRHKQFADALDEFVLSNRYTAAAGFYFEPGVIDGPAFQPFYHRGDSGLSRIKDHFDITHSSIYNKVQEERHNWWYVSEHLSTYGEPILTSVTPIYLNNTHHFLGVFVMDYALTSLNQFLKDIRPYKEAEIFVISSENIVIAQTDSLYFGYHVEDLPNWDPEIFGNEEVDFPWLPWKLRMYTPKEAVQHTLLSFLNSFILYGSAGLILLIGCMALAIRAIRRNTRAQQAIENEIRMAGEVQKSLLPEQLPDLPEVKINTLLRPAKDVAGDVYEVQQKGNFIYFMIGDVSGKGLQASMLMAMLSGLFRHEIHYDKSPSHIMSQLNRALVERNPSTLFCTMLIGKLDTRSGEVQLCNAGHNLPVLRNKLIELHPHMMLGIVPNYPYCDEMQWLNPGDTLLCYTDGVTEAMNSKRELFGTARLLSFKPHINTIIQAVDAFCGRMKQADDITMLSLNYTPWVMHSVEDTAHLREFLVEKTSMSGPTLAHTQLGIEEMAVNAFSYGQASWLSVGVSIENEVVNVHLVHNGDAFDPTQYVDKSKKLFKEDELQIGGHGISLVRQITREMRYERWGNCNHLVLVMA